MSYGVYLWHWPIYLVLGPDRVGLEGWPLTALRVAATLAVAGLSYTLLERPIRRGLLQPRQAGFAALASMITVASAAVWATRPPPGWSDTPDAPLTASRAGTLPGGDLDVLLIGDSVVQTLGYQLRLRATRRGLSAETKALYACGLLDSERGRTGTAQVVELSFCGDLRRDWMHFVAEREPRVVVILEGWPGTGDREIDGAWSHACAPAYDDAFRGDLTDAIRAFREAGSTPVIVTPTLPVPKLSRLKASPELVAERMECLNRVRREVADRADVELLDLRGLICPDDDCSDSRAGARLRPDGLHFKGAGAILASEWLLDQIAPLIDR